MPFTAEVHSGPHCTSPMAFVIRSMGGIDQVIEGARVKCGQAIATRGRRVCVEFFNSDGEFVTSRYFLEGLAGVS